MAALSHQLTPRAGPAPFSTERARSTVAVCIVFLILATIAVPARFWARRIKKVRPGLDDWLIVVSLIFYYLSAIQTMLQVGIGRLGHHIDEGITPEQLENNGKARAPNLPPFDGSDLFCEAWILRAVPLCIYHGRDPVVDLCLTVSYLRH